MTSQVPRGEIVVGLPLLAGAIAAIPFGAPYAQWVSGGACGAVPGTPLQAVADVVIVAAVGLVPFLFVLWPTRWLRGGRTIATAFLPLLIAFGIHACLVYPAAQNPLSTFLIDHAAVRSPNAHLVGGLLFVVAIAAVGVAPVWMTLSVRADTTAPRFEALLASCGLWLVVAATLARFFRAAQMLSLGVAAPIVLAAGLVTTLHALVRRRSHAPHGPHAGDAQDGPYRRDAKRTLAHGFALRGRIALVLAVELLLVAAWWPALADKVARPCPAWVALQ